MTERRPPYTTANKPRQPWPGETAAPSFTPALGAALEQVKREIQERKICGVCFTDSWQPCPQDTPDAIEDASGGFMVCGYCRLRQRIAALEAAARAVCGAVFERDLEAAIEELGRVLGEEG